MDQDFTTSLICDSTSVIMDAMPTAVHGNRPNAALLEESGGESVGSEASMTFTSPDMLRANRNASCCWHP